MWTVAFLNVYVCQHPVLSNTVLHVIGLQKYASLAQMTLEKKSEYSYLN